MKKIALHWKIIAGIILGVIWALISTSLGWTKFTLNWIAPWGTIFINLLKLIAVPLVLFSIIKGITDLSDVNKFGKIGIKTLFLYLITTITAVTVGLILVNIIKPGHLIDQKERIANRIRYEKWVNETPGALIVDGKNFTDDPTYASFVKEAFNENDSISNLAIQQKLQKAQAQAQQEKGKGPLQFVVDMVPQNIFFSLNDNSLMLQIIFFAVFFGVSLLFVPQEKTNVVKKVVDGFNEVFLKMVDFVMAWSPYFVFALLAGTVSEIAQDNPGKAVEVFIGLGWYSLTVLLGLLFMAMIFYPSLITIFIKKLSFGSFFKKIAPAQTLAFSSSSSAATLPVTLDCVENKIGVSKEVSSFVLPIGATVNMDGTSLYQAVAVVFLAQFHMVDLSLGQQLMIVLTATLASIGSAAVPSAGLVMLIIVLGSVGLNPAWIAIIIPIDRLLDMCRTVVNVTGDATVATLIAESENELDIPQEG